MAEAPETPRTIPDRYLVSLKPLANEKLRDEHTSKIAALTAAESVPFSCHVHNYINLDECQGYSATFDEATKVQLEQMPEVADIEPVMLYRHCLTQTNAPWGLQRVSTRTKLPTGSQTSGSYTYTYPGNATGQNVMAYVLDTGINAEHVEFEGRAIRAPQVFVTAPRTGAVTSTNDTQGHGTHCAGTIASRAYGVAKGARVTGVKVFNDLPDNDPLAGATNEDIIRALEWVVGQHRTRVPPSPSVVNLSLGGPPSDKLDAAVAAAVRSGIVVTVAAGNALPPDFIPKDAITTSPARTPLAITVAALNIKDEIAWFSYYGKLIDVVAPGEDILSTWIGGTTATKTISGTSMAAPHVAGVACCLLSDPTWPDKDPSLVVSEMLIRADKNKVTGLTDLKSRTVDAVLQVTD